MTPLFYIRHGMAILAIVGIPLALAGWVHRYRKAAWRYFFYGSLIFLVAQVFDVTLSRASGSVGFGHLGQNSVAYLGLMAAGAGILEELGRYVGYKLFFRGHFSRQNALMYGLGHGWMECLFVAVLMLMAVYHLALLAELDTSQVVFSPEQLGQIREALLWWRPLMGVSERMAMLAVHVMLSLVVLRAVTTCRTRWLLAAVGIHSLANFGIGLVMQYAGLLAGETVALLVAGLSLLAIRSLRSTGTVPLSSSNDTMTQTG